MAIIVINDDNYTDHLEPPGGHAKGLIPRDRMSFPEGCYSWAEPFPDSMLIPEDELQDALDYLAAQKATLADLRTLYYEHLQSLDQDGYGYCWAFSSVKAMMYLRAIQGQPPVRLSGWCVGAQVKDFRNQGGWGAESLEFIVKNGVSSLDLFPGPKREHLTDAMRSNMALHKIVKWWEGSENPEKAAHQKASAHARGLPTIEDFDWWNHSVCGIWTKKYSRGGAIQSTIDNSWTESAGDKGLYYLENGKARPNGLWIPYVPTAAAA